MSLIDKNQLNEKICENASWFHIHVLEDENTIDITLENGAEELKIKARKVLQDRAAERYQYVIEKNETLAFDHALVLVTGMQRLKNKIEYTDIVFHMMPEYFTLGELQQVYEVILGKKLLDPAFRRIIADKVEKTTKVRTGGGHRPSALFRYRK